MVHLFCNMIPMVEIHRLWKDKDIMMIKLKADEYENLVAEIDKLHKESIEFINEYITEMDSILDSNDGFHTEKVSEKIRSLLEVFRGKMFPEIKEMFGKIEREITLLGENVSEADEEGRQRVQWED